MNEIESANNAKNQWVLELVLGEDKQERLDWPLAQLTKWNNDPNGQKQKPSGKHYDRRQRNIEHLGEFFKNLCFIELESLKEMNEFLDSSKLPS